MQQAFPFGAVMGSFGQVSAVLGVFGQFYKVVIIERIGTVLSVKVKPSLRKHCLNLDWLDWWDFLDYPVLFFVKTQPSLRMAE